MALPAGGTPVTEETFMAWLEKRRKIKAKEKKQKQEDAKKKNKGITLTGRMLFDSNKDIFKDDDAAAGDDVYANRVTLSDDEDDDDDDDSKALADGVAKLRFSGASGAPPAPSAAGTSSAPVIGDASLYLEGDDDDLDDLDDLEEDDDDDE